MSDPVLNAHDLGTEVWRKIKEHFTERVETLRAENDANMNEAETAKKRGRIAEAKYVLTLGEKPIKITQARTAEEA